MSTNQRITVGLTLERASNGKYLKNGATCILVNGRIRYAAAEARFTRSKHAGGFINSLEQGLTEIGVNLKSVDEIGVSTCTDKKLSPEKVSALTSGQLAAEKIVVAPHHRSHAYSAFIPSGFRRALILVMDAGGNIINGKTDKWWNVSREQMTSFVASRDDLTLYDRDFDKPRKAGFGEVYRAVTYYLGWPSYTYSANTMALAAYGDENAYPNLKFFDFKSGNVNSLVTNDPEDPVLMIARAASDQNVSLPSPKIKEDRFPEYGSNPHNSDYSNLARRLQDNFTTTLLDKVNCLVQQTDIKSLCIAGGVGLNCVANRDILDRTPIENLFVQPAAGDDGQALGNALYAYNSSSDLPESDQQFSVFLGPEYDLSADRLSDVPHFNLVSRSPRYSVWSPDDLTSEIAQRLADGEVIAWFQGKSEYGPRALGHRSILADPGDEALARRCHKVKNHREAFRPFAPSVLSDYASEYFDVARDFPYMIVIAEARDKAHRETPGVIHTDGTSRIHTVKKDNNPKFYKLIDEFRKLTSIPMLLNTSFNKSGDPIVETPKDAIKSFMKMSIDSLVIGNTLVSKAEKLVLQNKAKFAKDIY